MRAPQVVDQKDTSVAGAHGRAVNRWAVFTVVSVALFMGSIDSTIVATALPTLHHDLHARLNWAGWIITAYTLGLVVAMPLAGRTGDQYGRKQVFLGAVGLFTVASVLCGLSTSIYELVPLRAIQAIGGGAFLPSAIGLISDSFGDDRAKAIGMTSSILPTGALAGPVLGSFFITYWSWRGIFFINLPVGALLLVLAPKILAPSVRKPGAHTDFVGLLLLAMSILSLMFAITLLGNGHTRPWSAQVLVGALVCVSSGVGFARRSKTVEVPIIPVGLIGGRGFLLMNGLNFIYGSCVLGISSIIPLYAQERYHISILKSGSLLTARAIGAMVIATGASVALKKTGYRLPMLVGLFFIAVSFAMTASHPLIFGAFWWLAIATGLSGLAFGLAAPATNNAILALAPDHVGAITGLRGVFRQSGSILGVSIATTLAARSAMPGRTLSFFFVGITTVLLATLPFVLRVPEREGTW